MEGPYLGAAVGDKTQSPQRQSAALTVIEEFFRLEAAGGVLLVAAAGVALMWANSPWRALYSDLLSVPVGVHVGALALDKPLLLWINDALMAVFFLDRKSTRLNSSHSAKSRMPSSA